MARTVLITGGSGKFGRVMIKHFLAKGDRVVTTGRDSQRLDDLAREFGAGERFVYLECDLSAVGASANLSAQLAQLDVRIDSLVNNARNIDYLKVGPDGLVERDNFAAEFLVDVIVPYELTMAIAGQQESQLRRVVNIGSQYGSVAANPSLYTDYRTQSPLHYGVCKAALVHLTKELAVRLAPSDIMVNCVAFGGVEGRVDADFKTRYAKLAPLGRMLQESEIAGPVDMLLSDAVSGMTGQVLAVDGGWTIW